jgi:hypothetical protein
LQDLTRFQGNYKRYLIRLKIANCNGGNCLNPFSYPLHSVAGKTLVSDGAANFHEAYLKEFWTQNKNTRTEHIRHIRLRGDFNNNKMERMNGELRDRERVMRTLENPTLQSLQVCRFTTIMYDHMKDLRARLQPKLQGLRFREKISG